jgi:hypothetical protein
MPDTGPHLAAALVCERVITEGDGVLSIIRVVDRLIQTATGADPPDAMPPLLVNNLSMVLALKSDQARGRFTVKVWIEAPSGRGQQLGEQDINLQPGNSGANLVIGLQLGLEEEGVYWMDVILGGPRGQADERLTRVPLEVVYQRQRLPVPENPADS